MSAIETRETIDTVLSAIAFDDRGVVPAVAQDDKSGEVLMLAWMNREAVTETLATGRVCYWSRSRRRLWRKGETSGQYQRLVEFRVDCDGDSVLLRVQQTGVACHTGRRSCFYRAIRDGNLTVVAPVEIEPGDLYRF
jgi:phosphoribosyl-AMP cyclohydrolase